jgi:alpha-L-rhamnosidase
MQGTYYLLKLLINEGRNDLIYEMANQDTFPGWGYMLENGATTIWEQWDGEHSHIHNTLISIGAWFIQGLGGIQYDPDSPGFKHFFIRPGIVGDLTHVRSSYRSIHGMIESNWTRDGERLTLNVVIPPNTTATVTVPAARPGDVTVEDERAQRLTGAVSEMRHEDGRVSFLIGAGEYRITSHLTPGVDRR